jgi:ABC-2 type transport system permease protein
VSLHGRHAHVELGGDVGVGQPPPDRERYLALAGTDRLEQLAGPVVARGRVGTAVASPGLDHTWALPIGLLGQHVVSLGTGMISGVALGAALLASAPAIVCQFALPLAWAIAGRVAGLDAVVHWLDPTSSLAPMTEHLMDATEWARAGTTLALWMVLPLLIGLWRIQRGEIR